MFKNALFVTKDMGSVRMALPMFQELRSGYATRITVVSEGKATGFWRAHGIQPTVVFPEEEGGSARRFVSDIIEDTNPDIVILGIGSPINLELEFLRRAKELRITTVALEDFHGTHIRLEQLVPDYLVVQDAYAEQLAVKSFGGGVRIVRCGTPRLELRPASSVAERIGVLRATYEHIALFVSGGTFDDLSLAIECVRATKGAVLIPRFHPKVSDTVSPEYGRTYREVWARMLIGSGIPYEHIETGCADETEHLAALADTTLSGFSLVLNTAVASGRVAVSLRTPESAASLKRQSGLTEVPLVALGLAHEIGAPVDLSTLTPKGGTLPPFQPEAVIREIFG